MTRISVYKVGKQLGYITYAIGKVIEADLSCLSRTGRYLDSDAMAVLATDANRVDVKYTLLASYTYALTIEELARIITVACGITLSSDISDPKSIYQVRLMEDDEMIRLCNRDIPIYFFIKVSKAKAGMIRCLTATLDTYGALTTLRGLKCTLVMLYSNHNGQGFMVRAGPCQEVDDQITEAMVQWPELKVLTQFTVATVPDTLPDILARWAIQDSEGILHERQQLVSSSTTIAARFLAATGELRGSEPAKDLITF